ncbi:MAG TPA: riboflavin biosynthesis protein RibF [Alphaproteobacteria bacterium]|nr:riboflavin biosynthesis protein RibF [Alphaproteobacteria bacterium]
MLPEMIRPLRLATDCHVIDWSISQLSEQISDKESAIARADGLVAAIGNFDGVHCGHKKLIDKAVSHGGGLVPSVITFQPHPRRYFKPDLPGFELVDNLDKMALLSDAGARCIIRLQFDDAMRQTTATDFVSRILPALGVRALYAGTDFAFGNQRGGGMAMMQEQGREYGIDAQAVELVSSHDEIISSSRIRAAIARADMAEAAQYLGRPYVISGIVAHGEKRGRTIGFPTANLLLGDYLVPPLGVYAISATLPDAPHQPIMHGVANIGMRPTVDGEMVRLEANLFDIDLDLYDRRINVYCLDFIRPEQKFENFDKLRHQIAQDVETAKSFHAKQN